MIVAVASQETTIQNPAYRPSGILLSKLKRQEQRRFAAAFLSEN